MKITSAAIKLSASVGLMLLINSCHHDAGSLTPQQASLVRDSVQQMIQSIAKDISIKGPVAWLRYFENSPDFFMAADGKLAFPNNAAAADFLTNTYAKTVIKIELSWNQVRIDPYTSTIAAVGAAYHEEITDTAGKKSPSDGYFTGIARQTPEGWQLRNAHWSIIPPKK